MKTVILVSGKDEEGILGLMIKGTQFNQNMFAASEGSLIAHDLIEHQNGSDQIGSIDDELEASGGIWYVRGQHGALTRDGSGSYYTIEQNIASDITRMFRDHFYGQYIDLNYKKGMKPVMDDENLKEIILQFEKSWEGGFSGDDNIPTYSQMKQFAQIALQRMRIGYSKARRKYEKNGSYSASIIFWNISDAVQKYCKPEYEGIEFKLSYNKDKAWVDEVMEDY